MPGLPGCPLPSAWDTGKAGHAVEAPVRFSSTMPSDAAKNANTYLMKCCSFAFSRAQSAWSSWRSISSALQNDATCFLYIDQICCLAMETEQIDSWIRCKVALPGPMKLGISVSLLMALLIQSRSIDPFFKSEPFNAFNSAHL